MTFLSDINCVCMFLTNFDVPLVQYWYSFTGIQHHNRDATIRAKAILRIAL